MEPFPKRVGLDLAEAGGICAARLSEADIAQHLACRELRVAAVAARQGVTPRYVQRLFGQQDTTFSQFVLGERLIQAHRMLCNPMCARLSVTAIAFDAGFGDLSYFNRSFRRRCCAPPSDVRKAALHESSCGTLSPCGAEY